MFNVLGCTISEKQLAQWKKWLVCDAAPFFLSETLPLPRETLVLSRKDFSGSGFELSYHDSYTTYAVSNYAKWVAFLTPSEFDSLSRDIQQTLLAVQCKLKRGQIYLWEQVEELLQPCIGEARTRMIYVSDEKYFLLDSKIWQLLTDELRRCWLIDFIASNNPLTCLSPTLSETEWTQMPCEAIRALAGTFAFRSGPNCFSTTLAAVTQQFAIAQTIADFWLHQDAFFYGLTQRGYVLQKDDLQLKSTCRDAVLVWKDEKDKAQHACYLIGNGLVLNKNSQAWFTPRQLLKLETVLDYISDDTFRLEVYTRDINRT